MSMALKNDLNFMLRADNETKNLMTLKLSSKTFWNNTFQYAQRAPIARITASSLHTKFYIEVRSLSWDI